MSEVFSEFVLPSTSTPTREHEKNKTITKQTNTEEKELLCD
ncbi:Hypothetical protein LEPBI_I0410 [Leptospira biflexa serovar Patoc strain 'Patoc 1 (Paris)']|uniref:Uncharacterized protein n=1 Tax=Leptospira biflexa serovar Patoc (strain Patoc 1 / ATCC 23582 / Paris) TaxID=456481 RepID=B0SIX2_LEPBP|nr:Hypothetical protein LEPBI_I0410 [Leptospira biflexa serovar Patoc strain 'Patoc 1 (Paris)']